MNPSIVDELAKLSASIDNDQIIDARRSPVGDVARESTRISEDLFMNRMRHEAGLRGVVIRNRADLRRYIQEGPRNLPAASAPGVDTDPITSLRQGKESMPPTPPQRSTASEVIAAAKAAAAQPEQQQPPPNKEEILQRILARVSSNFTIVRHGGKIDYDDTSVAVKCDKGHVHRYLLQYIHDRGLRTCHTCGCADRKINDIRLFMEKISGEPFIIESTHKISSESAGITVYRMTTPMATKMWLENGKLFLSVRSGNKSTELLATKIRTARYKMPNGRILRDGLDDNTSVSFDEEIFDDVVPAPAITLHDVRKPNFTPIDAYESSPVSFTSMMEDVIGGAPSRPVGLRW